jgi:formylglycine-generating enzyme required for sulfatase activity
VKIAPFFMGKYEVTQEQYQAVMGNNPSSFKGAKRPVENVRWNEAVEFCRKLSEKTGKNYRLPAEAEWEYACRAGTTTPFYFGDTITPDLVNYYGNEPYGFAPKGLFRKQTTEVGSFGPNSFGLYDMHGNDIIFENTAIETASCQTKPDESGLRCSPNNVGGSETGFFRADSPQRKASEKNPVSLTKRISPDRPSPPETWFFRGYFAAVQSFRKKPGFSAA